MGGPSPGGALTASRRAVLAAVVLTSACGLWMAGLRASLARPTTSREITAAPQRRAREVIIPARWRPVLRVRDSADVSRPAAHGPPRRLNDASAAQRVAGPRRLNDPHAVGAVLAWWWAYADWQRRPHARTARRALARGSTRTLFETLTAHPPRRSSSDLPAAAVRRVRLYRGCPDLEAVLSLSAAGPRGPALSLCLVHWGRSVLVASLDW
jgi:hypothetical protein